MELVENFNTYKKCVEEYCDDDYTHFEKLQIQGLMVYVCLCEKHANEWEVKG